MPFIHANHIDLYYELHGHVGSPVLILNNGVIMNAATSWAFQTRALSAHYRVLLYDCRGQGQSDHPYGEYSMELHADDLAELMKALNIKSAHVAGISYGGEVAQAFALNHPEKVSSLILTDTVSEVKPELRIIIESWIDALSTGDPLAFFNATVPWNFSPAFIRENETVLDDAKSRYAQLDFKAVSRLCRCFLEVNFTSQLNQIKVPACIMVGELDLIKGLEYARIIHDQIDGSELHVLQGAGHTTCWESSQEFNSIILGFLAKLGQ